MIIYLFSLLFARCFYFILFKFLFKIFTFLYLLAKHDYLLGCIIIFIKIILF